MAWGFSVGDADPSPSQRAHPTGRFRLGPAGSSLQPRDAVGHGVRRRIHQQQLSSGESGVPDPWVFGRGCDRRVSHRHWVVEPRRADVDGPDHDGRRCVHREQRVPVPMHVVVLEQLRPQRGRLRAASVIHCDPTREKIANALQKLFSDEFQDSLAQTVNPYGDGGASARIVEIIAKQPLDGLLRKSFFDLPNNDVSTRL